MRRFMSVFACILLIFSRSCVSIEPFMTFGAVAIVAAGVGSLMTNIFSQREPEVKVVYVQPQDVPVPDDIILFQKKCSDIKLNAEGLKSDLNRLLYGQHLVASTVLKSVRAHVQDKNPVKPLVLSFHGWTGGGKNFVSRIIAGNLYKEKECSPFFHVLSSVLYFKHEDKVPEYKDQLHERIYRNVSACGRSLFIFDELDKMPEGLIDVLIPFLGHNTRVDKVDFRKSIFLFLSNTGGTRINEKMLRTWRNGRGRESVDLHDMQEILKLVAYNEQSAFKGSALVHKNLIDHFVPFLPLERSHVRGCVLDEFKRQSITEYSEEDVEEVLNMLEWFPKETALYSKSGCKKVSQKVNLWRPDWM